MMSSRSFKLGNSSLKYYQVSLKMSFLYKVMYMRSGVTKEKENVEYNIYQSDTISRMWGLCWDRHYVK